MSIWKIIRRLVPFIRPHGHRIVLSLTLTLLSACAAQVNPLVLWHTLDTIERLVRDAFCVSGFVETDGSGAEVGVVLNRGSTLARLLAGSL
jgi:hypothetical protein